MYQNYMKKIVIYFYIGLIVSVALATLATLTVNISDGGPLRIAILLVIAQTHFIIAYLYYIDILRVKLQNPRKVLLFLIPFLALVIAYYFTRYIWLIAFAPLISLLTTVYFLVHHFENIYYFGENFHQNLLPEKRTNTGYWFVAFIVASVLSVLTYSYYVLEKSDPNTLFTLWLFLLSFGVLGFITYKLYTKINTKKALLFLPIPVVFVGPLFLQSIAYVDLRFFIIFWHVFMWMLLYPLFLRFRNKETFPKEVAALPSSLLPSFLRKTRSTMWNFIMFYAFMNALLLFLYVFTAKVQGVTPLSDDMVYNSFFWGIAYFDMWAFAHITFSFFPKRVMDSNMHT